MITAAPHRCCCDCYYSVITSELVLDFIFLLLIFIMPSLFIMIIYERIYSLAVSVIMCQIIRCQIFVTFFYVSCFGWYAIFGLHLLLIFRAESPVTELQNAAMPAAAAVAVS